MQPLDFFGGGTRIPLIVVAPTHYLTGSGYISHQYSDHFPSSRSPYWLRYMLSLRAAAAVRRPQGQTASCQQPSGGFTGVV